ncbi:ABC transporter substrate-binding protein [Paeniroseomonas aquatica]|uniref:ABC transporter substrate-binding protein n=1 Tax=Paeniroseomonas aquatica TaxID=373043 RepID=A0ABT8A9N1_9PROT|nr:ABC transporter substrate-binding protein [Paeniroseomonas aquatica]MDN3566451.1 ABC transporter substrate-binding protein [Paeniroseomonas aquatica]
MLNRRMLLASALAAPAIAPSGARAQDLPGVTASEIRIGNTMPYSGPASAYGSIGRSHTAFFRMVNDQGGVGGRRINFITYDDGYSPPKTVEQTRRLVEQDKVAFLFNPLGTASNSAIVRYMNQRRVPHLFLSTGADKWGTWQDTPWTIGWQPSYRTEAQIYVKHMLEQKPNAKLALLYQNDDFGKDYVTGVRDILGPRFDGVVRAISHEATDPTIDSQVVSLQGSGADVLLTATTPKFAAQTIRRVADVGWKPLHYLTNVSISVGTVMEPAGPERGIGIITSAYLKDPTDPAWANDAGMNEWRAFMAKYLPDGDLKDGSFPFAYGVASTLMQVLKQCEGNFARESIMRQVAGLKALEVPTLLPGILVNTAPDNFHPIRQMQLRRWTGTTWEGFGGLIEGAKI